MSKCREAYEAQYPYPYTNRLDYETWQTAWDARGKVDAEICRAQSNEPECPERATYCAEEIEKENTSGWVVNQPTETKCVAMCFEEKETQKQEPVAWCFVQNGYTHYTDDKRDWYDAVGIEEVTPLYAAPAVQPKQEPFPFSAERVTYHKAGAIGAIMPCGTMVTNVKEAYEAGQAAAPVVQPDTVLVPRVPTEEMLAVIRNERGAYGTGESLYADLIAAAEGRND